ncbi:MAG TPA: FtsQ-type POTRA domain-containing protein [Smithellaceae bacterium]|nr:FtsQ-type POTRA domain-containing protein [Smithellaceae bacterium]
MTRKIKAGLEARRNRWRRRLVGAAGESLGGLALLAASAALGLCFVFLFCAVLSSPYFEIREVRVQGVKELTEKDILVLAEVNRHRNILAVNLNAVEERIAANPWVKRVVVGRELPDRLVVDVCERKPVALVKQKGGFYLMDAEGVVFKKLYRGDDVDLAVITGLPDEDPTRRRLLPEALALLERLSAPERGERLGLVSEVKLDEIFGLSLLTDRGLLLKLGMDQYEQKLKQLDIVLADLEKRGMRNGYLFVDLADLSKITVQRRELTGDAASRNKGPRYRM